MSKDFDGLFGAGIASGLIGLLLIKTFGGSNMFEDFDSTELQLIRVMRNIVETKDKELGKLRSEISDLEDKLAEQIVINTELMCNVKQKSKPKK